MPAMPMIKAKSRLFAGTGQSTASASSTTSNLPLATLCLLGVLLFDHIGAGMALRCYQSQQMLQAQVSGSPMECPVQSYSCIKSVDFTQNLVTRACQPNNCTLGGMFTTSSNCQNTTNPNGILVMNLCCCYGDGCNGAVGTKSIGTPGIAVLMTLIGAAMAFISAGAGMKL